MKLTPETVRVGDGVTGQMWSDSEAFTVIRVSTSGKTFWAQEDKATLKPDWKPEIIPGGFVGHCINQDSQEYDYEPNRDGFVIRCSWSEKKQCFHSPSHGFKVMYAGRHKFHDYNF